MHVELHQIYSWLIHCQELHQQSRSHSDSQSGDVCLACFFIRKLTQNRKLTIALVQFHDQTQRLGLPPLKHQQHTEASPDLTTYDEAFTDKSISEDLMHFAQTNPCIAKRFIWQQTRFNQHGTGLFQQPPQYPPLDFERCERKPLSDEPTPPAMSVFPTFARNIAYLASDEFIGIHTPFVYSGKLTSFLVTRSIPAFNFISLIHLKKKPLTDTKSPQKLAATNLGEKSKPRLYTSRIEDTSGIGTDMAEEYVPNKDAIDTISHIVSSKKEAENEVAELSCYDTEITQLKMPPDLSKGETTKVHQPVPALQKVSEEAIETEPHSDSETNTTSPTEFTSTAKPDAIALVQHNQETASLLTDVHKMIANEYYTAAIRQLEKLIATEDCAYYLYLQAFCFQLLAHKPIDCSEQRECEATLLDYQKAEPASDAAITIQHGSSSRLHSTVAVNSTVINDLNTLLTRKEITPELRLAIWVLIAECYTQQRRHQDALFCYQSMLRDFFSSPPVYEARYESSDPQTYFLRWNAISASIVYHKIATQLKALGQVEASQQSYLKSIQVAQQEERHLQVDDAENIHQLSDVHHPAVIFEDSEEHKLVAGSQRACLDTSVVAYQPSKVHPDVVMNRLGSVHHPEDIEQCSDVFHAIKQIPSGDASSVVASLLNLGNLLHAHGQHQEAVEFYKKTLAHCATGNAHRAWASGNLGNTLLSLNQNKQAGEYLKQALELTLEHEPTPEAIGRACNNLGTYYQALGEFDEAMQCYNDALSQAEFGHDKAGTARAHGNIGNIHMLRKQPAEAQKHYREVLKLTRDSTIAEVAHHNLGCACFDVTMINYQGERLALSESQIKQLDTAIIQFHKVWQNVWQKLTPMLRNYVDHANRNAAVKYLENHARALYRLTDSLMLTDKVHTALSVFTLSYNLTSSLWILSRFAPNSLKKFTFMSEEPKTDTEPKAVEEKSKEKKLDAGSWHQQFFDPIERSLYANLTNPIIAMTFTGTHLCTLGIWKQDDALVKQGSTIYVGPSAKAAIFGSFTTLDHYLRYRLGEDVSGLHLYTSDELGYARYQEYGPSLNSRLQGISDDKAKKQDHMISCIDKAVLEVIVNGLTPILKQINEATQQTHSAITLVLDSYMSHFPFELLPKNVENLHGSRLFNNKPLQLMPSVMVHELYQQEVQQTSFEPALLVGNPSTPPFMYNKEEWDLGPLPYAETEAQCAATRTRTQAFVSEQATKDNVLKQLPNSKIIHFATHGSAGGGFLVLGAPKNQFLPTVLRHVFKGESVNNLLLTHTDIAVTKLLAKPLVILSSCDSAKGTPLGGELTSCANAFLIAGARAVICFKFKAPDESQYVLLNLFYSFLTQGVPALESMQKANNLLQLIPKYGALVCWASSQYMGSNIRFEAVQRRLPNQFHQSCSLLIEQRTFTEISASSKITQLFSLLSLNEETPFEKPTVIWLTGTNTKAHHYTCLQMIEEYRDHYQGGISWVALPPQFDVNDWLQHERQSMLDNFGLEKRKLLIIDATVFEHANRRITPDELALMVKDLSRIDVFVISECKPDDMQELRQTMTPCTVTGVNEHPIDIIQATSLLLQAIGHVLTPENNEQLYISFNELVDRLHGNIVLTQYIAHLITINAPKDTLQLVTLLNHINEHMVDIEQAAEEETELRYEHYLEEKEQLTTSQQLIDNLLKFEIDDEIMSSFKALIDSLEGNRYLIRYIAQQIHFFTPKNTEQRERVIKYIIDQFEDIPQTAEEDKKENKAQEKQLQQSDFQCEPDYMGLLCCAFALDCEHSKEPVLFPLSGSNTKEPLTLDGMFHRIKNLFQFQFNTPEIETNILIVIRDAVADVYGPHNSHKTALLVFNELTRIGFLEAYPSTNIFQQSSPSNRLWRIAPLFYQSTFYRELIATGACTVKDKNETFISFYCRKRRRECRS
ncbi:CHAT domain-containing protein [Parashewanella curva]|uniref:CHAT domain-containing protein n=1 Tax=Parashewanella curva TaxID=2338552 RepID=A0A3L8PWC5_9GAMM|nr:CHAT domain-containing tetratricopeptide repeat protein [Parashewanella curva]RLV58738.1 CHAT domain-containing protein [Parashewanella curva]